MSETTDYEIKLSIEDGNGVSDANSYVTLPYFNSYCVSRGYSTVIEQSDYIKKAAIVKAMDYVDNLFDWKGRRKFRDQPLKFPRIDIRDEDGFCCDSIIPEQLKKAVCEAAFYVFEQYTLYKQNGYDAVPKKERKKADTVEIENEYYSFSDYFGSNNKIDYTSKYQALDTMLRGLYIQKGTSKPICRRVRWE